MDQQEDDEDLDQEMTIGLMAAREDHYESNSFPIRLLFSPQLYVRHFLQFMSVSDVVVTKVENRLPLQTRQKFYQKNYTAVKV